jgi:molybdopterin molybdotransferase
MFVRPVIRRLAGHPELQRPFVTATALQSWRAPSGKAQLARGELSVLPDGTHGVRLAGSQGSHVLGGLAQADCLVQVPADVTAVDEGDRVRCLLLGGAR